MLNLASETGWSEDHILRRMPLARALRYWHAMLWKRGVWTTKKSANASKTIAELLSQIPAKPDDEYPI